MAIKTNIFIDQGTTFSYSSTYLNSQGDPRDFTGITGASQMRKSYSSNTAYAFDVTLSNAGVVILSMNATTTSSITAGRYVYDVELTSANGAIERLVEGIITVTPQVTR